MPRETDYHELTVPEPGDSDWGSMIADAIDDIDSNIPVDFADEEPTPGQTGRLLVNHFTDRDAPVIQIDADGTFTQVETAQRWDVHQVGWLDRDHSVFGSWLFAETLSADISGVTPYAHEIGEVENATEADRLDGFTIGEYAIPTADRTVTGQWEFEQQTTVHDGLNVTGGTLGLSSYDEPTIEDDEDRDHDDDGGTEPDPRDLEVSTGDATDLSPEGATLNAELKGLGGHDSVYVGFAFTTDEDWELDQDFTHRGPSTVMSAPDSFSQEYPASGNYGKSVFEPGETVHYQAYATTEIGRSGVTGSRKTVELPEESIMTFEQDEPDTTVDITSGPSSADPN